MTNNLYSVQINIKRWNIKINHETSEVQYNNQNKGELQLSIFNQADLKFINFPISNVFDERPPI